MKTIPGDSKLTIKNFDKRVGSAILQRGQQYYDNGAVLNLEENSGKWTAEIEGSDIYRVAVTLKYDSEITGYFCDCPYDADICKHLVATFFTIREEIGNREPISMKKPKKSQFETLLDNINIEEYRTFVRDYVTKSKDFKIAFELFFADKDDRIDISKIYAELIKKLIKKYTAKGYIDYRSSIVLAKEVNQLTENGYALAHKRNFMDAFSIATCVLKELMQVLTYTDDSSGSLAGATFKAIKLVDNVAESDAAAPEMKEGIFIFLQTELNDRMYFDYGDFGYELFYIFESLAIQFNKEKEFLGFIDSWIPKLTGQYDDYKRDFFKKAKISFLQDIGKTEEAEKLVQQNLEIKEVRQGEVNKAIDRGDFSLAKKLIEGGIKVAEANKHPGTVSQWKKELLRIAVLENDIPLVRQFCKHFTFDRSFDSQYYNQWKATYSKEDWTALVEELISQITAQKVEEGKNKNNRWYSLNAELLSSIAPIYIEEKYWSRLLELVKNESTLPQLTRYHSYLASTYPAELLQLYLPALVLQGDNASDRSQYAALVITMKRIIKDIPGGKDQMVAIAQDLKVKYPRRPAMIDELNSLLRY